MKKILYLLLSLCICACSDFPAKKWVEEAKPLDSIHVVSPEEYADIEKLQLRGLTLEQVELLYGKHHWDGINNLNVNSPEEMPEYLIDNYNLIAYFKESDYPINISSFTWFRRDSTRKLFCQTNDDKQIEKAYQNKNLGQCLEIFFVKYDNKLIAFDAHQTDCWATFFAE